MGEAFDESTASQPDSKTRCISCKSEINQSATLCPICKTYQNKWKGGLQYIASIAGIITILAGLWVYIISGLPLVRKVLFWKDKVKVLSFDSNQDLVITNVGDGEIFLSHIDLRANGPDVLTSILRIGISVPTGAVLKHRFFSDHPDLKERPKMILVSGVAKNAWNEASRRAAHHDDPCFAIIFYYAKDPSYLQMVNAYQEKGQVFQTIPSTATLHFYSVGSKKDLKEEFPVVGTVTFRSIPTCPQ